VSGWTWFVTFVLAVVADYADTDHLALLFARSQQLLVVYGPMAKDDREKVGKPLAAGDATCSQATFATLRYCQGCRQS
jgi:hypothetical protein